MSKLIDMATAVIVIAAVVFCVFGYTEGTYLFCAAAAILLTVRDFRDNRNYRTKRLQSIQERRKARMNTSL